ncbi:type IV-A pilus assembly ATPase PilB, partial [Vibrio parahaemolyticus]|nr:type IV-A pilus assembly ATPase PilB [Vibrio parahaemolyticus]
TNLIAILRQAQLLSLTQEKALVEHIQASGASAPEALLDLAIFDSQELSEHISQLFALPIQNLSDYAYPELCQQLGLRELIMRYQALPIENNGLVLTLAMADPTHLQAEEEFRFATGLAIEVVLADYKALQGAIRRLYGRSLVGHSAQGKEISQDELASLVDISDDEQQQVEDLSQDDSPVSRFINQILLDAVRKGASDIHFEPYESLYRVRLR